MMATTALLCAFSIVPFKFECQQPEEKYDLGFPLSPDLRGTYMREYMLNDRLRLCHGYIVPRPARRILNWIDKLSVENTQGRTRVVRPPARNQLE